MRTLPERAGFSHLGPRDFAALQVPGKPLWLCPMMRFRLLSGLLLALVLGIGAVGMAVARVQAPMAGTIVICSGSGMMEISVDAEGQPVGTLHLCPDCTLAMAPGVLVAQASGPLAVPQRYVALILPAGVAAQPCAGLPPQARGPPILL